MPLTKRAGSGPRSESGSVSQLYGSGSVPKCHGSTKLETKGTNKNTRDTDKNKNGNEGNKETRMETREQSRTRMKSSGKQDLGIEKQTRTES